MTTPSIYVRGLVAYDGSEFHGFQYQLGVATVQGALEQALAQVATVESRVNGAGRTDAGVHANGQVVAVRLRWRHGIAALQRAWNAHLPAAIRVRAVEEAAATFHPRFSAVARTYRYYLYHAGDATPGRPLPRLAPLVDRYALYVNRALDVEAMQAAADLLPGEHDFATFGQAPQGDCTVRRLEVARWQRVQCNLPVLDSYPGEQLVFTVRANAFLHHMVRNLVGSLLEVGHRRWPPSAIGEILRAADRARSAPPVPAKGLVLEQVTYPADKM